MPPKRSTRHSSGPATKGSQKTLAFSSSKVSKPTTPTTTAAKSKLAQSITSSLPPSDLEPETKAPDVGHVSSEAAIAQQASAEVARVSKKEERSEEEERATKVTDAQIRKYWRERENERRAPRVHQQELGVEEKVLRLFDISSQYGPCIGIARMKRWVRANKLGLNPPIEVLAVLMKEEEKGNAKIERAHVDELMSSKYVIGEA